MKTHNLKTWPQFFEEIIHGQKKFEYRKFDRDFQPGDRLELIEYDPEKDAITGRRFFVRVLRVLTDIPGMPEDYCILDIEPIRGIQ
jgi:hypothetical protein